ncbi:HEPN domain-containing protein [Candidatus Sumerlaeota bacterium]|nr:HEPN domain-containing protein [Candidatus Sumerlaeota bacterium]
MDVEKQIAYWWSGATRDLAAARSLLEKKHPAHALFFAHLALEKALKAHVCKTTQQLPPKTHNLVRLAQIAKLFFAEDELDALRRFDKYQIEGRYPGTVKVPPNMRIARGDLAWAGKMVNELKRKL